ncbi:hypothetical protein CW304_04865 [Bacillus sp. UFRGS-B20]|nr:hypothetical protein CW304_04865 [Bacillus sp. UFRGS-B20]
MNHNKLLFSYQQTTSSQIHSYQRRKCSYQFHVRIFDKSPTFSLHQNTNYKYFLHLLFPENCLTYIFSSF